MYSQKIKYNNSFIVILASETMIHEISFDHNKFNRERPNILTKECCKQLREFFKGERNIFDLPLELNGTEFQKSVWGELAKIPYGETRSYEDIAISVGNKNKVRAIGMANHRNKFPIIIPCHRVINKNGNLGGYAGGVDTKVELLKLEKSYTPLS